MMWIPIIFVCLSSGGCGFVQGEPTYTEAGCMEQLAPIARKLDSDKEVLAFDTTCIVANPI